MIENLLNMLKSGQDNHLLRFGLGSAYLDRRQPADAIEHLRAATRFNPGHSASWKLYGRALADSGQPRAALQAFATGIDVANRNGDIQAAKEMEVFRKRVRKTLVAAGE